MKWLLALLAQLTDSAKQSLQCLIACIAFMLLVVTVCVCLLLHIAIDPSLFWAISALICAFAGIGAAQFSQYRKTDYGFVREKGEADAKVAAATQITPPTPVVQNAAPAVEIHS